MSEGEIEDLAHELARLQAREMMLVGRVVVHHDDAARMRRAINPLRAEIERRRVEARTLKALVRRLITSLERWAPPEQPDEPNALLDEARAAIAPPQRRGSKP